MCVGGDVVLDVEEAIAYARRRTQSEISRMPNGVYTGESWLDASGDGRENVPIMQGGDP